MNTGRRNGPAAPEGTGWECDKLSPTGADTHFAGYIGRLASAGDPVDGGLLKGIPVADARTVATVRPIPQVVSAAYGDPGDAARRMDVTALVRGELSRGLAVIRGNNESAETDPAPKTRKKLLVEMRLPDGGAKRLEAWEGDALVLVEPWPQQLPDCEVKTRREVLVWKSGTYRVTRGNGATSNRDTIVPGGIALTTPLRKTSRAPPRSTSFRTRLSIRHR
ncbi:MAG: hypothetical protein K9N23_00115 [Akkermansiaceae bacterium]|nr:hypothetical protein [Akkermansiaceae bacterium]MCF7730053.1 hypothetical protein [Akkermansiaceae bacterium]